MRRRPNPNLGCIDPHGYFPFPASRAVCPKCQAIQASQKRGLPYGWWKSPNFWAFTISVLLLAATGLMLFGMWFWGWQAG